MKRLLVLWLVVMLLAVFVVPGSPLAGTPAEASSAQTYNIMVGWENAQQGIDLEAFFPHTLKIHVGDTVRWTVKSHEIHTVSFLAGSPMPALLVPAPAGAPSPLALNPQVAFPAVPSQGLYDGLTFANSGIMSLSAGQTRQFSLTFTRAGTFHFLCLVHGEEMSGDITVENQSVRVPLPGQATAQGNMQRASLLAKVPAAFAAANKAVPHAVHNADGTITHYVMVGFMSGQIDLMRFFPRRLEVRRGDTVVWQLPAMGEAPHTVTFLNGAAGPDLFMPYQQPGGPLWLVANPALLAPSNMGQPLTRSGIFSSGLLSPDPNSPHSYTLKIGAMAPGPEPYECLIHDESGMTGTLVVEDR